MKILLLGAPGSGKTKFAKKLAQEKKLKIFDKLPQSYIKRTGLALGEISDYRSDFMFVSEILLKEYKNQDTDYVITAGPLYSYAHFAYKANFIDTEQKKFDILWMMMAMSKIALDSLWYDEIYYLPYKKEEESFSFYMDINIQNMMRELYIKEKVTTVE